MKNQYINEEVINQLGINLEGQDKQTFITHLNDTLDERIGSEIIDSLDDSKVKELLELQKSASSEEISSWMTSNVPELKDIVQDEIDILIGEVAENGDAINNIK